MYFEHIPSSIEESRSYKVDRIILNFVAFEREFRNLYSEKFARSKDYYDTREEVINYLKDLIKMNNGNRKKKKYLNSFISVLEKTENSYGDRVHKALIDCEEILQPFLKYFYNDYKSEILKEIADRMNDLRNDFAHANMDLNFEAVNINDFEIFSCLLYAMRLKYICMERKDIQNVIKELMNINIHID